MCRLFFVVQVLSVFHNSFVSASPRIRCWNDHPGDWQMTDMDMFQHPKRSSSGHESDQHQHQHQKHGPEPLQPRYILKHLSETPCQVCSKHNLQSRTTNGVEDTTTVLQWRALFILSEHSIHRDIFLSIATGLLWTNSFQISIVILAVNGKDEEIKTSQIQEQIWSGVPCDHPARSRRFDVDQDETLTITLFEVPSLETNYCQPHFFNVLQPFDNCAIQMASTTFHILSDRITGHTDNATTDFDVMITDPSLVGAMWWSERNMIPTVALTGPSLIPLAVEHDPAWTPFHSEARSWWGSFVKLFRQRYDSLAMTKSFLQMNSQRRSVSLPFLLEPMDYLQTVAVVLMEFAPWNSLPDVDTIKAQDGFALLRRHWRRTYVTGPLQPACIPCSNYANNNIPGTHTLTSASSKARKLLQMGTQEILSPDKKQGMNNTTATLLVVPPTNPTPIWSRTVLQALHLARESLHAYDDCDWDPFSCHKHFQNFSMVWLVFDISQMSFLPPVTIPGFSQELSTSLLDGLAKHPETVIVLMPCDRNTPLLEHSLGIDTICLEGTVGFLLSKDQKTTKNESDPRELAAKILKRLRARQQQEENEYTSRTLAHDPTIARSSNGGLSRAVGIIQKVAETNRNLRPWKDAKEMQRITTQAVLNQTQAPHESSTTSQENMGEVKEFPLSPYDNFTIFVAWFIVAASTFYICLYHFFYLDPSGRRVLVSCYPEALFARPSLGDAWMEWLKWYQEQPQDLPSALCQILWGVLPSTKSDGEVVSTLSKNHPSSPHHQAKRKKKK